MCLSNVGSDGQLVPVRTCVGARYHRHPLIGQLRVNGEMCHTDKWDYPSLSQLYTSFVSWYFT